MLFLFSSIHQEKVKLDSPYKIFVAPISWLCCFGKCFFQPLGLYLQSNLRMYLALLCSWNKPVQIQVEIQANVLQFNICLYQTGMFLFAFTLIMDGYKIDEYGVHISNVMKVGAAIYLFKLLNTKDFVSRHKNMPLIIISFFTPVLSVMLFLFF
jgi:hypothetical protein